MPDVCQIGYLDCAAFAIRALLLGNSAVSTWSSTLIWFVRIITLGLLLRTYIVPAVLRLCSDRVRVRSISLRSIRGIYVNAGDKKLHIERIRWSYHRSSSNTASRVAIRIEGLKIDVERAAPNVITLRPPRRPIRASDFAPFPIARRLWSIILKCAGYLEPTMRPIVRAYVVMALRLIIRIVPPLTHVIEFELDAAVVSFAALSGVSLVLKDTTLHTALSFSHLERVIWTEGLQPNPRRRKHSRLMSVIDWKDRFASSLERSWDRAWGKTQGEASVSLRINRVACFTRPWPTGMLHTLAEMDGLPKGCFLNSPGTVELRGSVRFNPRKGTTESHSIRLSLNLRSLFLGVNDLQTLLEKLKQSKGDEEEDIRSAEPDSFFLSPQSPEVASPVGVSPITPPPRNPWRNSLLSPNLLRRGPKPVAIQRLKRVKQLTWLSTLNCLDVHISSVHLRHTISGKSGYLAQTYKATVSDFSVGLRLSNPIDNPLHRKWLGREAKSDPHLDAAVYALDFSLKDAKVERLRERTFLDVLCLASLKSLDLRLLTTRWPSPLMPTTSYMTENPNEALLAIDLTVGDLEVQDQLDMLCDILSRKSASEKPVNQLSILPTDCGPVPRVMLDIQTGSLCARLICADPSEGSAPLMVQAQSDGLVTSVHSHFITLQDHSDQKTSKSKTLSEPVDYMPLRFDISSSTVLKSTFVRLLTMPPSTNAYPGAGFNAPTVSSLPIVSLETLELNGAASTLGYASAGTASVARLDASSAVVDLYGSTDALSIELWQPDVITALRTMATFAGDAAGVAQQKKSRPPHARLPFGLIFDFSLERAVVLLAGLDINPSEELGLSRGIVLRSGYAVEYCALQPRHLWRFKRLQEHTQTRQNLDLPETQLREAVAATRASLSTNTVYAFVKVDCWDLAVRDAVATNFEFDDDPFSTELGNAFSDAREFLNVSHVRTKVALHGSSSCDSCDPTSTAIDIGIFVPDIRCKFHLAHSYCLLLGLYTALRLLERSSPKEENGNRHTTTSPVIKSGVTIGTLQVLCDLPVRQRLCTRVDGLKIHSSSISKSAEFRKCLFWVYNAGTSRTGEVSGQWEELGRLRQWNVAVHGAEGVSPNISAEGNSARLRIPYGYVLADLVQDVNISVKALRHLYRMTSSAHYFSIRPPEAEEAKRIPDIRVRIQCFSFDAMDDPFESKLGLITRAGFVSARVRDHREEAFALKATTVKAAESSNTSAISDVDSGLRFTAKHSVPVEDAHRRLLQVHSVDYVQRHRSLQDTQSERESRDAQLVGECVPDEDIAMVPNLVEVAVHDYVPRLFNVRLHQLSLYVSKPSFPNEALPEFLHLQGSGLPLDTQFTLLVPLHLHYSLASLRITLRDYPLPLLNIPEAEDDKVAAFVFETDLVIAEEMGTAQSVDWYECIVLGAHYGSPGASSFSISVPKTIMPVKTYAKPVIHVTTKGITDLAWGVSYHPATQDVMRVIDGLTSAPRDHSPAVGFWDKIRLTMHWQLQVKFDGEVHLHMKGSRDPYEISDKGAGFALCWQGNTRLDIAMPNTDHELVQVTSDTMLVVIPNPQAEEDPEAASTRQDTILDRTSICRADSHEYRKVCAKFSSGVRFGIGLVLERSCGPECDKCHGPPFKRECRLFTFRPHYEVKLERKLKVPELKSFDDSYDGFRSDFIHLSISLTSATTEGVLRTRNQYSSLHLTPKTFTHFWSWWGLFDSFLSLPIRQGRLYRHSRPQSPKFGRHLATIKYRISVKRVFISHVYLDESDESWADGVTSFVGMKALISDLHADMHQRDQEIVVPGSDFRPPKVTRRKPFYAAEVVMKDLDLRAMLATFKEPLKQSVPMEKPQQSSRFRAHEQKMPYTPSAWVDENDYVETDWISSGTPVVHLLPAASCPRFTYFKSTTKTSNPSHASKSRFGDEDSHSCFLGKEDSVSRIQSELAHERIRELQRQLAGTLSKASGRHAWHDKGDTTNTGPQKDAGFVDNQASTRKMIALLEAYIAQVQLIDVENRRPGIHREQSYYMPLDTVSSAEWAEFDNVYQVHCPKIFMSNSTRDILLQYYYCSRTRRGFEYHMATRAVKFMRDQARSGAFVSQEGVDESKPKGPGASAQAAAQAFLRRLAGDDENKTSVQISRQPLPEPGIVDPLGGCSDGVSLRQSHFCLLLKPQIVLRSEASENAVCVLAAVQAKLQSFGIMDNANAEDPVSGKILTRTYTSLTGLQTFSPTGTAIPGDGCVPLEVLIDLRCESSEFDRLVPQTDASFHYDKFNRLRLRSDVSSRVTTTEDSDSHLHHQTDLIQVHVPQFTVSADDQHFQAISNIVTDLILFTDATHKTRLDKLETLLFRYDFTDLSEAANVVSNLQSRLRHVMETERSVEPRLRQLGTDGRIEMLKIKAHILLLAEELNLIFDAIKLAQDKREGHSDHKSALLLQAISSEISWRMLDDQRDLLAKLSLRQIDYTWLSRQDSSTENNLAIGDLQAFDGSSTAVWAEIISKHNEPSNHPLVKRGLFLLAHWIVLAPVGGITVFQDFELRFHPMRLQIDTRVGRRIMEYLWPGRKNRRRDSEEAHMEAHVEEPESMTSEEAAAVPILRPKRPARSSLDSARPLQTAHASLDINRLAPPPLRRLGVSRSFTDLRSAASSSSQAPRLERANSYAPFGESATQAHPLSRRTSTRSDTIKPRNASEEGDAALMKTRSSQKTFIRVRVDSLHLLLSVWKQGSFLCRGAHIRTRELLYRNQTWSFEELVDQFIPSDPSWKGWVKMALQQPLVPVLPVARELFSKTQWVASKGKSYLDAQLDGSPRKLVKSKPIGADPSKSLPDQKQRSRTSSPMRRIRGRAIKAQAAPAEAMPPDRLSREAYRPDEDMNSTSADDPLPRPTSRARMMSLFKRGSSRPRASADSSSSDASLASGHRRQSLDHI